MSEIGKREDLAKSVQAGAKNIACQMIRQAVETAEVTETVGIRR